MPLYYNKLWMKNSHCWKMKIKWMLKMQVKNLFFHPSLLFLFSLVSFSVCTLLLHLCTNFRSMHMFDIIKSLWHLYTRKMRTEMTWKLSTTCLYLMIHFFFISYIYTLYITCIVFVKDDDSECTQSQKNGIKSIEPLITIFFLQIFFNFNFFLPWLLIETLSYSCNESIRMIYF